MEIKSCAAIVTGGASGMGAATAKMLSAAGAKVTILDVNQVAAEKVAKEIHGLGLACDVTNAAQVEAAIANANSHHGIARICINCAGVVFGKRIVGKEGPMSLEDFRKVIEINLIGTFNVLRVAAAAMTQLDPVNESQERGVIINTASVAAYEGQIGQAAYSASKGGIVSLTLPAARELAQFGIRVNAIAPGLVDTPMFDKIPPEARAALENMVPFPKRLAHPSEFAKLVMHIIDNDMINGEVIRLDGALRMQPK